MITLDAEMKNIDNNPLSWMLGLALNSVLVFYVQIIVKGGPDSLKGGADWPTLLNEVPQTILIILVAVLMPYMMLHFKRKAKLTSIIVASRFMLATTVCASVLIFAAQSMLTKELTLDIGWALLWVSSFYFVLIPESRHD